MKLSPPTTRFDGAAGPADPRWSEAEATSTAEGRRSLLRRPFLWLVLLPTLLVGVYFYGFAADQYLSEARFVVRGRADAPASGLLGTMLGQATGANAAGEALAVREFLTSHDAVRAAAKQCGNHDAIFAISVVNEIPADLVFDMVYNPLETVLLRRAREARKQTISGLEMFVEQAAAQFEIWTGQNAPRVAMRNAVLEALGA